MDLACSEPRGEGGLTGSFAHTKPSYNETVWDFWVKGTILVQTVPVQLARVVNLTSKWLKDSYLVTGQFCVLSGQSTGKAAARAEPSGQGEMRGQAGDVR
jgi:hypothetical protein